MVDVYLDDCLVSPPGGYLFRKAPGNTDFDFGQTVLFDSAPLDTVETFRCMKQFENNYRSRISEYTSRQPPEYLRVPYGFILKIVIISTWGDSFYVGLNGIELYDVTGCRLLPNAFKTCAIPSCVSILPEMNSDVRKLDNIFQDRNHCNYEAESMWLTPFTQNSEVLIYAYFDVPVSISVIKFWNYLRTPDRGAKDIQIFMEDHLIWQGVLRKAPDSNSYDFAQSILFSTDLDIVAKEEPHLFEEILEPEVSFYDEKRLVKESKSMTKTPDYNVPRPATSCIR